MAQFQRKEYTDIFSSRRNEFKQNILTHVPSSFPPFSFFLSFPTVIAYKIPTKSQRGCFAWRKSIAYLLDKLKPYFSPLRKQRGGKWLKMQFSLCSNIHIGFTKVTAIAHVVGTQEHIPQCDTQLIAVDDQTHQAQEIQRGKPSNQWSKRVKCKRKTWNLGIWMADTPKLSISLCSSRNHAKMQQEDSAKRRFWG